MKKVGRFVAIALLLVTGVLGLREGVPSLRQDLTPLQHTVTVAVLLYGVLGTVGAYGLVRARPWIVPVTIAWAVATTYAATVASFAFHDPALRESGTRIGTASAFAFCALMSALVVWVARKALRPDAAPTASPSRPGT